MDKVIGSDKYYKWEIEDLHNFYNLEMLQSYIHYHYNTYNKKALAKIIYSLIESCIAAKYITDKDIYSMFLECIKDNNKYFEE